MSNMRINDKVKHYNNNIKTLGKVLDTKRIALNLTIRQVCQDTGINKSTLADFFHGKTVPHPVYYNEVMKYLSKKEQDDEKTKQKT